MLLCVTVLRRESGTAKSWFVKYGADINYVKRLKKIKKDDVLSVPVSPNILVLISVNLTDLPYDNI